MNTEQQEKGILSSIQNGFAELKRLLKTKPSIKNGMVTFKDGQTLFYEGETPEVGMNVFSDEAMSQVFPDGSYEAEDGTMIKVENGAIIEIISPSQTVSSKLQKENNKLKSNVKILENEVENLKIERDELFNKQKDVMKTIDKLTSKVEELGKLPGGNPVRVNPDGGENEEENKTNRFADSNHAKIYKIWSEYHKAK